MQGPDQTPPPAGGSPAGTASSESRRQLGRRALDWAIGALAMLGVVVLAVLMFWLSITQPADDPDATPSPGNSTPPRVEPTTAPTPPPNLAEDEVWLGDISLNASSVVAAGTPLLDVVGFGTDVTSGPDGLVARHLDLTATVPFHVVAAQIGPSTTLSAAGGGEARIHTWVEAWGRQLSVAATGNVTVVAGKLVMEPTSIDIGAPDFISELLGDLVRELITIEYAIEGLPDGVVLQSVTVMDDGFRAHLTGDNIRLVS